MTTVPATPLPSVEKPARAPSNRPVLIVIAVLLALLLAVATIQLGIALQQSSQRAERAVAAQALVQSQQSLITSLMTDYEQAAYKDPNVDTIYQQQLIASEHILQALHIMAIQNSQVIELLAVTP
jgi:uncharacterized membrane protein affecting hemolysin expression